MKIKQLLSYLNKPKLYTEGNSIMWTDPYISKQLLDFHINPENDIASRNAEKIDLITNWILKVTNKSNQEILDLGCGPGLYTEKLAKLGHKVTGIDFSENSIAYAKNQAVKKQLNIEYINQNYLEMKYQNRFDLIMMIYTDFGVLLPAQRERILKNIHQALKPGGVFIFDVVNTKNVTKKIMAQSWEVAEKGFWKDTPYMVLANGFNYPQAKVLLNQHLVIDEKKNIKTYHFWTHYFDKKTLNPIVKKHGFEDLENFEDLLPSGDDCWNGENITFYKATKIQS